jgi:hypothetical protein
LAGGIAGSVQKLRQNLTAASGAGNSRKLLLIREDEPVKVRFLQNPDEWMIFYEHYVPDSKMFVPALDPDPLSSHPDERVRRTSLRHMANVLNIETMQVQLLKMNQDLTNRLMMRFNRYENLTDRNYEIVRSGTGLQTVYDIEPDDPEPMDLARFSSKLHDMTLFLLQEADRYHGTDYAEEYERSNGGNTLDEDADATQRAQDAAAERAQRKADEDAKKEAELKAKFGDAETDPLPWEEDAPADDAWAAAKANGLPCDKGADGKCTICSFDVSECLVAKK